MPEPLSHEGQNTHPSPSSIRASHQHSLTDAEQVAFVGDDMREAKVTIHPRISPETERVGTMIARRRRKKVMTFWSEVVEQGLPLVAALGQPDAAGRYGPWSGEELARQLRLVVAQLIEFQIQHHQIPGHLLMYQQTAGSAVPTPSPSPLLESKTGERAEVFEATTDSDEAVQGFVGMGFGTPAIFQQQQLRSEGKDKEAQQPTK